LKERGDKRLAGEEFVKPVECQAARRELEGGACAKRHPDDDDERGQQAEIDGHHEWQQRPRKTARHGRGSKRPAFRVAKRAANSRMRVRNTKLRARLEALGQLNDTRTSS